MPRFKAGHSFLFIWEIVDFLLLKTKSLLHISQKSETDLILRKNRIQ